MIATLKHFATVFLKQEVEINKSQTCWKKEKHGWLEILLHSVAEPFPNMSFTIPYVFCKKKKPIPS